MKKLAFIIVLFTTLTAFTPVVSTWFNDDAHSQLGFTVTHLGIADVSGTFNDFDAKVSYTNPDLSDAIFELTARTGSINTRVEARDNHLKSADFFNVEKYPTLHFKSTSIRPSGMNEYKLTGDLSLNGITKQVTMDLLYRGSIENPASKKQTVGFQVTGTIKRSDFNLGNGFPPPLISNEVRIKADGEFAQ